MSETFSERLLELQKDPGYFNPQKLEKLKIVFDRVCQQMGITGIEQGQRSRDKLATIVLIGSKMYPDDNELVNAAITAMNLPSVTATSE